jgi:hypothetical protein
MQTANDHQKIMNDPMDWYLIAEGSIDKDLEIEIMPGSPFQILRKLGLPPEYIKRVERTIIQTAQGAADDFHFGSLNAPVEIHLFCHKRMVDRLGYSEEQVNGGWGYYDIERGNTSSEESHRVIEIYLYKEGL